MWLLSTSTAELRFFNDPSSVRYAILSHVWGEHEQTFQEVQALRASHFYPDSSPRARASAKVRECCIYAEKAGYAWVWIDTCCIDKTSSAELSEAINSMYAWYARAAVCYAILEDVQDNENPAAYNSTFRRARWWTRGWTLQELVAPRAVVFLARGWRLIGTKHSLANVIEEISNVDRLVLVHGRTVDDISVARRMSWAARRITTREEDQAYSLMGLFGVMMPVVYGEGPRAFQRLQEEILRHTTDQSIFAWGPLLDDYPHACQGFAADTWHSSLTYRDESPTLMETLLAPSPVEFAQAGSIRPISTMELSNRLGVTITNPHYSFTSSGVHTRLPIIPYPLRLGNAHGAPSNVCIAVLACEHSKDGSLLLFFLRRKDGTHHDYYAGDYVEIGVHGAPTRAYYRIACLSKEAQSVVRESDIRDVYIHNRPHPALRVHLPRRALPGGGTPDRVPYTFILPPWVLSRLREAGFVQVDPPPPTGANGDTDAFTRNGLALEMFVLPGLDVSAVFRIARVTSATFAHVSEPSRELTLTIGVGCVCQLTQKRRGFDAFWVDVAPGRTLARMRQQWAAGLATSGTCTREHLGHTAIEFNNARGRVRVTTAPWGDVVAGSGALQNNCMVDLELLDANDRDVHFDDPESPVDPPSIGVRTTLRRAVEMWMSLRGN